tara:strand:- start:146 stop:544 length:399 start_codon:yes stop_codon:yes gene_type:complete
MKVLTDKGFELEIRIDADAESVDFYNSNGNIEASFNAEPNDCLLEITVDDVRISEQRQGIYSAIIDAILFNEDFHSLLMSDFEEYDIENACFKSVLRSENACEFWVKRGYGESYDEHDHQNGQQEVIEIEMF